MGGSRDTRLWDWCQMAPRAKGPGNFDTFLYPYIPSGVHTGRGPQPCMDARLGDRPSLLKAHDDLGAPGRARSHDPHSMTVSWFQMHLNKVCEQSLSLAGHTQVVQPQPSIGEVLSFSKGQQSSEPRGALLTCFRWGRGSLCSLLFLLGYPSYSCISVLVPLPRD